MLKRTFFVLDFRFHILDSVARLYFERDCLAGECFHEDLHDYDAGSDGIDCFLHPTKALCFVLSKRVTMYILCRPYIRTRLLVRKRKGELPLTSCCHPCCTRTRTFPYASSDDLAAENAFWNVPERAYLQ